MVSQYDTNTIEQKFKQKCNELKKRIAEIEESNEISTIALSRTRMSIRRLRLEHSILMERLEDRVLRTNEVNEMMSHPPDPTLLDDSLNIKLEKNGVPKSKKSKVTLNSLGTTKRAVRDPDLPKRPTNAYLMFCEREKERIKTDLIASNSGRLIHDLSKILTDTWKGLDEEQKKPYQLLYVEDRERYKREMLEYNKKKLNVDSKDLPRKQTSADEMDPRRSEPLESDKVKRQRIDTFREKITKDGQEEADSSTQEP